jgi:hypothetical protein
VVRTKTVEQQVVNVLALHIVFQGLGNGLVIFPGKIRLLGIDLHQDPGTIGYDPSLLLQQDIDQIQPCPEFIAIQNTSPGKSL